MRPPLAFPFASSRLRSPLFGRGLATAAALLANLFTADQPLRGADFYWDADSTTAGAQYGADTGVWSSTQLPNNWSTGETGGSSTAWVNAINNIARFGSATQGTAPANLTLTLGENITLLGIDMGGSYQSAITITNAVGNNFTLNFGTANGQIKPNSATRSLTIDVVMQGTGGMTKTNNGTAILTQNNTYTGGTTITTGTLQIGNGGTTGTLGGGDVTVAANTILRFNRSDALTVTNKITGTGTLNHAAASTLTLDNAANSVGRLTFGAAGTIDILANTLGVGVDGSTGIVSSLAGANATVNGTGGGKIAINANQMDIAATGSGTLTLNVALINGTGNAVDITGGTVIYTAANTYTGQTRVQSGTLRLKSVGAPSVLGDISVAAGATLVVDASVDNQIGDTASVTVLGTFNSSNRQDTFANLTIDTTTLSVMSNLTITGTLTVTRGTHEAVNSSASLTSNATVLGGGSIVRLGANSGASIWNMGAGGLTMTGTTIKFGNEGATGVTAQVNLGGNVTASGTNAFTVGTSNPISIVNLQGATRTFDITDGTTSISPSIRDLSNLGAGITKTGAGALTLYGNNTYTGKTTVTGGTLALATETVGSTTRSGSIATSAWIDVATGATFSVSGLSAGNYILTNQVLSGSGTLQGTIIVGNGAVLKPGASSDNSLAAIASAGNLSGKLTTGDLTLNGGTNATAPRLVLTLSGTPNRAANPLDSAQVLAFSTADAGGQHDQVAVNGTLRLDGGSTIVVEFAPGYKAQWGDVFNLIDWTTVNLDADGTGSTFTLADLVLPTTLDNGWFFRTDRFLSDGIIYVVPEPSRALLLLGALGVVCLRRRRR